MGSNFHPIPYFPNCFVWLEGIAREARIIWSPKSHVNAVNMQLSIPYKNSGFGMKLEERRTFRICLVVVIGRNS